MVRYAIRARTAPADMLGNLAELIELEHQCRLGIPRSELRKALINNKHLLRCVADLG